MGINLVIDGSSYPMNIPIGEEANYRQAARLINETLVRYKQHFEGEDEVRVITMAAINIAYDLVTNADKIGTANVMHKITELSKIVDSALEAE